jgi:hypothetical protein
MGPKFTGRSISPKREFVRLLIGVKDIVLTVFLILCSLDPIWTIKTDSLFLFTVSSQELFTSDGLVFILKDFDKLGGNEKLGVVTVPAKTLYEANGERMEFKLQSPSYKSRDVSGYMAIRCRKASPSDIKFMEESRVPKSKQLDFLHKAVSEGKTGAGTIKSILSKRTRVVASGKNAGKKQVSHSRY